MKVESWQKGPEEEQRGDSLRQWKRSCSGRGQMEADAPENLLTDRHDPVFEKLTGRDAGNKSKPVFRQGGGWRADAASMSEWKEAGTGESLIGTVSCQMVSAA